MSETERKRKLRKYRDLFVQVAALLFRHDPVGINFEKNTDEYDPEARTILPRLKECSSAVDVRRVVHEEFVRWFGEKTAGPSARYAAPACEIWDLWTQSGLGRPE